MALATGGLLQAAAIADTSGGGTQLLVLAGIALAIAAQVNQRNQKDNTQVDCTGLIISLVAQAAAAACWAGQVTTGLGLLCALFAAEGITEAIHAPLNAPVPPPSSDHC